MSKFRLINGVGDDIELVGIVDSLEEARFLVSTGQVDYFEQIE